MDFTQCVEQRRSIAMLAEPAPSLEVIEEAVRLALLAPDHRRLTPWRFVVLDEQAVALVAKTYAQGDKELETKWLGKLKRAPLIVAVLVKIIDAPKVPEFEQLLSAGAATEHFLLSMTQAGFASMWRSGEMISSKAVKQLFGLEQKDYIAGFIYLGTEAVEAKPKPALSVSDFLSLTL